MARITRANIYTAAVCVISLLAISYSIYYVMQDAFGGDKVVKKVSFASQDEELSFDRKDPPNALRAKLDQRNKT